MPFRLLLRQALNLISFAYQIPRRDPSYTSIFHSSLVHSLVVILGAIISEKSLAGNVANNAVSTAIAAVLATFIRTAAASTNGFTEPNAISIKPDYGITNVTAQMGTNAYLPCKVSTTLFFVVFSFLLDRPDERGGVVRFPREPRDAEDHVSRRR